jgi:hypothetical protein
MKKQRDFSAEMCNNLQLFSAIRISTHMSRGYTSALAITAPVAPATAKPQGGMGASFDCPAIVIKL